MVSAMCFVLFCFFSLNTALRDETGGKTGEIATRNPKQKTTKLIQPLPKAFRIGKQSETSQQWSPNDTVRLSDQKSHRRLRAPPATIALSCFLPPLCLFSICQGIGGKRQYMGKKL